MKILHNPEIGATIKDIMFNDDLLFSSKNDEAFEPGMVVQCEDDVADFLLGSEVKPGLFQFLKYMEPEKAKRYLAETKDKLKCIEPDCEFTTRLKSRMLEHEKGHKKDKLVSDLGIPLIGRAKRAAVNSQQDDEVKIRQREEALENENKQAGLEGEGLRDDTPQKTAIMS